MLISPVPPPSQADLLYHQYSPGLLMQDVYTLPVEAGVAAFVDMYGGRSEKPWWPFTHEHTNHQREPSAQSARSLQIAGGALVLVGGTILDVSLPDFPTFTHARGLAHAHLLNELATGSAKMIFQRHRPFYDTARRLGTSGADDARSFFSGHSSHAFTFANYTSHMMRDYTNPWVGWTYTVASFATAGWLGAERAIHFQHHWSDVIVGGVVGLTVSELVYRRVAEVISLRDSGPSSSSAAGGGEWSVSAAPWIPDTASRAGGRTGMSLTFEWAPR